MRQFHQLFYQLLAMMKKYIKRAHTLIQTNCIKFWLENPNLIVCHLIAQFSTVYNSLNGKLIEIYYKRSF